MFNALLQEYMDTKEIALFDSVQ